ncbi:hypothetical protein QE152_g12952 [Popillia japonica]|uniref:Uncharacterized protein n=1 Tax=Popillia japonica TaxID=7064 RepID=A0AAW1LFK2_POPJA
MKIQEQLVTLLVWNSRLFDEIVQKQKSNKYATVFLTGAQKEAANPNDVPTENALTKKLEECVKEFWECKWCSTLLTKTSPFE